jgi:predicted cupin superfamily sugar epimerase
VTDPSFEVSLEPPKAPLKAGQAGAVEVVLVAKAPFHVNDKYPIKLKLKETPGVKYASMVIGKDAAKIENMKAVVPVTFTPEAGKRTVAGQFLFSVCTDDKCLMEKRDLELAVMVE